MELDYLQGIWAELDAKLDRNWKLNLELVRQTNLNNAKRKMNRFSLFKGLELAFYAVLSIASSGFAITNWEFEELALLGIMFAIWTASVGFAALYQLKLVAQIDYSDTIAVLQKKLTHIKLFIIWFLRFFMWLGLVTMYLIWIGLFFKYSQIVDLVTTGGSKVIIENIIFPFLALLSFAIWAHRKLNPKNTNRKWMKRLLREAGSRPINDALQFLDEIDHFQKDDH